MKTPSGWWPFWPSLLALCSILYCLDRTDFLMFVAGLQCDLLLVLPIFLNLKGVFYILSQLQLVASVDCIYYCVVFVIDDPIQGGESGNYLFS